MKHRSNVIRVTVILLVGIIVSPVIDTYFHLPWLWPADKWPDFWVALYTGVITLATIGVIATFVVELMLKDIEEQRSKKQLQAECEREWAEFKQNLWYLRYKELPYSSDINYADMATPHYATVLANLFKTLSLSRWQRGLFSPPRLLYSIRSFSRNYNTFQTNYNTFQTQANKLAQDLRSAIDQYNRNWVTSGHTLDAAVSEKTQRAFCLGLILEDYKLAKERTTKMADMKDRSPEYVAAWEELFKVEREDQMKGIAADMLWHFHLPEAALPYLYGLYAFVREKVLEKDINDYGRFREQLEESVNQIFQYLEYEDRLETLRETPEFLNEAAEILKRIQKQQKQGKYVELDQLALVANNVVLVAHKATLDVWILELEGSQSKKQSELQLMMNLKQLSKDLDVMIEMETELELDQKPQIEK